MNITKMLFNRRFDIGDGLDDPATGDDLFGDAMHDALSDDGGLGKHAVGEDAWFGEGGAAGLEPSPDAAVPKAALPSVNLEATFFGDTVDTSPFETPLELSASVDLAAAASRLPSVPALLDDSAPPFDPADFEDDVHLLMMSSIGALLPPPAADATGFDTPLGHPTRAGAGQAQHPLDGVTLGAASALNALPPASLEAAWAAPMMPVKRGVHHSRETDANTSDAETFEDGEPTREIRPLKPTGPGPSASAHARRRTFEAAVSLRGDDDGESATQSYDIGALTQDEAAPPARRDGSGFLFSREASNASIPRALSSGELVAATEIARVLEAAILDLASTSAMNDALADISVAMNKERATIRVDGKNGDAAVELEVRVDGDKVFLTTDPNGLATLNPRRHELEAALADAGFTFSGFSDTEHAPEGGEDRDDDVHTPLNDMKKARPAAPTSRPSTPARTQRSVLA